MIAAYFTAEMSDALKKSESKMSLNTRFDRSVFFFFFKVTTVSVAEMQYNRILYFSNGNSGDKRKPINRKKIIYLDDVYVMARILVDFQESFDNLYESCRKLGLVISALKTHILKQPGHG